MRQCKVCGVDISQRGNRAIRCIQCQKEYRKRVEYQKEYQKIYWQENKDRYKQRWISRLGTNQDKDILNFIKRKRECLENTKYNSLPDSAFTVSNQAMQSYPDLQSEREDKFNLNYEGEIEGYIWEPYVGYVTEDPDVFFGNGKKQELTPSKD